MTSMRVGVLLLVWAAAAPLWAAPGTSGAQWLTVGGGARAHAMGGAYVSIADDGAALSWNPAGLVRTDGHRISITHTSWLSDAGYQYAGYAGRLSSEAGIGGTVEHGAVSWDNTGDGDFTSGDFCGALGYARRLGASLSVGGGVKFISSELGDEQASSYAADLGVLYEPWQGVTLGAAARNLGPGMDFGGGEDPLPSTVAVGASCVWRDVLVALDIEKQNDLDPGARLGVEYRPVKPFALRGGAVMGAESALSAFTAGVGLTWNDRWSLDYAYRPSELTDTHRFAVSGAFGGAPGGAGSTAPGTSVESEAPVGDLPESNIAVATELTREVVSEALDRMTIPARAEVYLREVEKHDASWLVQSVLLEELTSRGNVVKAGGLNSGDEGPGVFEVSYRIVACQTSLPRTWREWIVGARLVERKTDVDIHFQLSSSTTKDVVWAGNASRTRHEVISGSVVNQLATPGQPFTEPTLESGGWDKVLEPLIVAGIVGGLIYLFYTSQESS